MIFKAGEQEEELVIGGELETVESNIDIAENLAFVLDTVSSKFYSNPIGSIVREITSNCFDAHVESQSEEPVVIKLYYDLESDGSYIVEFIDKGVGMSDERFNKIYMNWFSSTKRNTNEQIGGWGLGSKSPFSYTNQFMITTVYDNIKTTRLLSKVQGGLPKAEVLYRGQTSERNGTTIRLDIANYSDAEKFSNAMKTQLRYFDGVYIDSPSFKFDNVYRIYDTQYFKYRSGSSLETWNRFSTNEESQKMHILLGNVVYPINWEVVGLNPYYIPIGVKFNIGEIAVTPNREAIEYREESVQLIKERIKLAINEVKKIFNSQNPEVDDLATFIAIRKQTKRITFSPPDNPTIKDYLFVSALESLETKVTFRPLKEIESLPYEFFQEYRVESIENGLLKEKRRFNMRTETYLNGDYRNFVYAKNGLTKYGNLFLRNGSVIIRQRMPWKEITELLGYKVWRSKSSHISEYERCSRQRNANPPKLGSAIAVYKFRKFVQGLVEQFREYPIVSEQWIKDFKKQQKEESNLTKRKLNGLVIGYDTDNKGWEIPLAQLDKSRFVFYIMKDDDPEYKQMLIHCRYLISGQNKSFVWKKTDCEEQLTKPFEFWIFNKTNFKQLKELGNLIHIKNFYRVNDVQAMLNRVYLATLWKENWLNKARLYERGIYKVSTYYARKYEKVSRFISSYNVHISNEELTNLKNKIIIRNHYCTFEIRSAKKELDVFIDKAEVLQYIAGLPLQYQKVLVNKFLKTTKLKKEYYGKGIDHSEKAGSNINGNSSGNGTIEENN